MVGQNNIDFEYLFPIEAGSKSQLTMRILLNLHFAYR